MNDLEFHESIPPAPTSITTELQPERAPSVVPEVPSPDETIQKGGPLSTPGYPSTSDVSEDGFFRMMSKEIEKVRQLIADAGPVAPTVTEFVNFEEMALRWENGPRRTGGRSVVEDLLEHAIDKAAVAYRKLRDSGAVRANSVFDELLSDEQRRERRKAIARSVREALHGSGEPLVPPTDLTLDKLLALPVHAAASVFPMLEGSALERLTEDIRLSGCRQPISVARIDGELTLLDGRNRLLSCEKLGIMPPIRIYEGEDPVSFIRSQNIRRRHLKPSVRASIAHELLPEIKAEARKRMMSGKGDPEVTCTQGVKKRAPQARDVAAEASGTSGSSVQRRETIEAKGTPSLKAAVNAGTLPVHLAAKAAVLPKAAQEKIVRQVATGKNSRKEIRALIDAAKAPAGLTPSKSREPEAPVGPTPDHEPSAWDLTAALIHFDGGVRAEGTLDGTTYEFIVNDLFLRVRKPTAMR